MRDLGSLMPRRLTESSSPDLKAGTTKRYSDRTGTSLTADIGNAFSGLTRTLPGRQIDPRLATLSCPGACATVDLAHWVVDPGA